MLLIVDSSALKPENDTIPMRSGSLTALKRLSDRGVIIGGDTNTFGELATRLLAQEGIHVLEQKESRNIKTARKKKDTATLDKPVESITVSTNKSGLLQLEAGATRPYRTSTYAHWDELVGHLLGEYRSATHTRKTRETDISVTLHLDGSGKSHIDTGLPFFDHMLEQIARHGYMDIKLTCRGDTEIDEHHTIEDVSITLGEAIGMALGDKRGIGRYGFAVTMDESRSLVALDLSGRPWCVFEGEFHREKVGDFPTEMTSHFFHSLAMSLKASLHVSVKGKNDHHQIEACFKGLARCLRQAIDRNEAYRDILPTSKGML